jgi:DNA-binding beta-propeller fold protein YncE
MPIRKALLLVLVLIVVVAIPATAQKYRQIAMLDLPGEPGFDAVAVINGQLVISHQGANTVDVFDPAKRRLTAQVTKIAEPKDIVTDPDNKNVYIAAVGGNAIVVLDAKTWQVQGLIGLKFTPDSLLYIPNQRALLVGNPRNRSVSVVPVDSIGRTTSEVATFDVQGKPAAMAWDPQRRVALVTIEDRAEVIAVNPSAEDSAAALVTRYQLKGASQPTGIVIDSNSRRAYICVRYAVLQLDADNFNELARVPVAGGTTTMWLDTTNNLLMASAADGSINVIRTGASSLESINEFRADVRGHAIAYDAEKKLFYIPGGREGKSKLVIMKQFGLAPTAPQAQNAMAN